MSNFDGLCKEIFGLSEQHQAKDIDDSIIKSFARIALDTVTMEDAYEYKHFTNAAIGACKRFDARNCKTSLGVMGTIEAFEGFDKNKLVVATDISGWRFELTELGATIVKLALQAIKLIELEPF